MSIEEAIVKHAEALEKLAAALTLKAEADLKAAEATAALTTQGLKLARPEEAKDAYAALNEFMKVARKALEAEVSAKHRTEAPQVEAISHEDLPSTGAEAADPAPAAAPAKEPVTAEVLRNLCVKLAADKGRDYVLGVLAEFGAQRLGDIKPEQYQALYDALTAEG